MFRVEVIGNLGADAKIISENGKSFISFNVAHTDSWTDDAGQKHETTQWISCTINDSDSKVLQFLKKGKQVFVRGNAKLRVFSSEKERRMVAGISVSVREIELIGGQVREVPKQLNDSTGRLFTVFQAFYIDNSQEPKVTELMDTQGNMYDVVNECYVQKRNAQAPTDSNDFKDGQTFD